jgi:hypothetical protein
VSRAAPGSARQQTACPLLPPNSAAPPLAAAPHAQGQLQLEVVVDVHGADGLGGHHLQALNPGQPVLAHRLERRLEALGVDDRLLLGGHGDRARRDGLLGVRLHAAGVVHGRVVRRWRRRRRLGALALLAHGGGGLCSCWLERRATPEGSPQNVG